MSNILQEKQRKRAHILYEIMLGKDMSKLEVKNATGYSMSTVISAVDELAAAGLILHGKAVRVGGGKPPSVINVNALKLVAGVAYSQGVLYGKLRNIKGEDVNGEELIIKDYQGSSLSELVSKLLSRLLADKEQYVTQLVGIGLSVAGADMEKVQNELSIRYAVPCHLLENVEAVGYHYRWQSKLPMSKIAAISVGNRLRCAVVDASSRVIEVGELLSPITSARRGRLPYNSVLSTREVSSRLKNSNYRGDLAFEAASLVENDDIGIYVNGLQLALSELLFTVDKLLSPDKMVVFGEYLSDKLMRNVMDRIDGRVNSVLSIMNNKKDILADGAAAKVLSLLYSH